MPTEERFGNTISFVRADGRMLVRKTNTADSRTMNRRPRMMTSITDTLILAALIDDMIEPLRLNNMKRLIMRHLDDTTGRKIDLKNRDLDDL